MNKEINTIIANLEGCIGMFDYLLTPTESNLLVAYIEELQQENEKLKDNWNELKEFMSYENISRLFDMGYDANDFINEIEGKIKELEEAGIGGK